MSQLQVNPTEIPIPPALPVEEIPGPREPLWPAVATWKHAFVILALMTTIVLAFCNSYQSGMTLDNKYIIEEYYKTVEQNNTPIGPDGVQQDWVLDSWTQVGLLFTNDYWWPKGISGLYRPITSFTYWLDYVVLTGKAPRYDRTTGAVITTASGAQVSPAGQGKPLSAVGWKDYAFADGQLDMTSYHTINLTVHWINAVLIYFVSLSMFKRVLPAAFVALLFAAHPITTESVTNIIGRADMFAATAIFGGLLLHMRSTRYSDSWALPWLVGLALITAFGVFSKESAAAVIMVVIVYDAAFRWRSDNESLFGLPPLVLHGVAYLALIGTMLGLPAWMSRLSSSHHIDTSMLLFVRILVSVASMGLGVGVYAAMFNATRLYRFLSLLAVFVGVLLASLVTPFYPLIVGGAVVGIELLRATLTSDNPRFKVVIHAIYYLPLYFGLIGLPVFALWYFHHQGWDVFKSGGTEDWIRWWIRFPAGALLLAGGLLAHFATVKENWPVRVAAVIIVALLAVAASFFSYWMGIVLGLTVAMHELLLGSFVPRDPGYRRDWRLIFNGFSISYLAMIPALLAMFVVRWWLFSTTTPPEEPFLDNPIRGVWRVAELGMPSYEAETQAHPMLGMSFAECKMTAVKVMGKLLYLVAWPQTLCSDYSFDEFPNFSYTFRHGWEDWKAVLALLWMVLFFVVVPILAYKRNKPLFFMVLFFFVAALPTSNLTITIGSVMAERFMYLPLAGFTGVVVIGIFWLARKFWDWTKLDDPTGFGWPQAFAASFLSLVVVVYGVRAYYRNFVWISDLTLWNDAIQTSTRSFRCYQSLAFALYEQDAKRNIDKMIALDEQGIRLVDGLPIHLNSSRMYLHLGMYYSIKANTMCQPQPGGGVFVPTPALNLFDKSIKILERGAQVDRAFNELNRTKQILRGDDPVQIMDVGLTPIYGSLGETYMKLGKFDTAYHRLVYQRQMDPLETNVYINMYLNSAAMGDFDNGLTCLLEALFTNSNRVEVWRLLKDLCDTKFANQGGAQALAQNGNAVALNANNPLMRNHLLAAYKELITVFRQSHRFGLIPVVLKAASAYNIPESTFDEVRRAPIEFVTPDGVQHGVYDPIMAGRTD